MLTFLRPLSWNKRPEWTITRIPMSQKTQIFFELLRAGLWADAGFTESWKHGFVDSVDWEEVYRLAEEQSVVGVILAGIERANKKPSQDLLLQWIGEVQILEQQNHKMNRFVAELIEKMRSAGIYTLLVKGQGIANSYEKPLWRCSGDVDLFLSDDNYKRAKDFLVPFASEVEKEYIREKHLGMTIDGYVVELHGTLRSGLSSKIEKGLDDIKNAVFYEGKVRSWTNSGTQVFLLAADEDVVYVFTHMLQHFFKEGLGLRQVCDWCRLLWTYKESLDHGLLELRIRRMGLVSEWKAFGAFAVDYLGIQSETVPLYSADVKWKKKADMICAFTLEVGNMGHNRDMSYFEKYPYLIRKIFSMGRRCGDLIRHARIFPLDSLRFFPWIMFNGLRSAVRGE